MVSKEKISLVKKAFFITWLFYATNVVSQSINAPTFAFTQICASPGFNTYSVNFNFSGSFSPGNSFVLEMSDASGIFTAPTTLTSSSSIVSSPGSFTFAIPSTTAGQNYKLRVRSTNPPTFGSTSVAFPAYYQAFNQPFYINNQVSNVGICGPFTLAIDAATPADPSPRSFPNLKYKWFRNGSQIAGLTGNETAITINSAGVYRCEIDYGSCSTVSSLTKSQDVTVSMVTGGSSFSITSSTGTSICPPSATILSTQPGYNYQWFGGANADSPIAGANNYTYSTTQPGKYKVQVDQGGCSSTSNVIELFNADFSASLNVNLAPATNVFIAGETQNIAVTTAALTPTYQWYFEGNPIPGEINSTFSTTIQGNYKVRINQTTGCVLQKELSFILKEGVPATKIPNIISPNADPNNVNNFWEIPNEYLAEDTEILIVDSYGKQMLKTLNYKNDWPKETIEFKSTNPIFYYIISKNGSPIKKGTITVVK